MLPGIQVPLFCLLFLALQQTLGLECGLVNLKAAPWSNQTASKPPQKHDLIIGGEEPKKNEIPWVVVLYLDDNYFTCTGSLIAPNYVLTAHHCVSNLPRPINGVYVGYGSVVKKQMRKVKVANIFDHPWADISVLELSQGIHKTPVCLPKMYNSECQLEKNMVVAGFGEHVGADFDPDWLKNGTIFDARGDVPEFLLWTNIEQQDWTKCEYSYQKSEFCAGGLSRGVMHGDSGGPVMKVEAKRVVQIGITSRGVDYAVNHRVFQNEIYVNVGYHAKWIDWVTRGTAQFRSIYDPCNVS
uniref:Peptidase S1 domain-containing protein n=1 Tax=Panagrellus redivivus TaxID=6233 RepID=A0A7E4UQ33_PANRE